MKKRFFLLIFIFSLPLQALSQEEDIGNSAFDPFIDYGEFQENTAETEAIEFFQNSRSIALYVYGGYEMVTFNIRRLYGDSPALLGFGASFFMAFHFAIQISGVFPTDHYNSLLNTKSSFSHFGLDLKWYVYKQFVAKERNFFNPYFIVGPFWFRDSSPIPEGVEVEDSSKPPIISGATETTEPDQANLDKERETVSAYSAPGFKIGLGFEAPLFKQSFIGAEVVYLYTNLNFENQGGLETKNFPEAQTKKYRYVYEALIYPNRPELKGAVFSGDLIDFKIFLGIDF